MKNQPTIQDVLQAVQALPTQAAYQDVLQAIQVLPTRADYQDVLQAIQALPSQADYKVVTNKVDDLTEKVTDLAEAVQGLASHMDEQLSDIRSEMATKLEVKKDLANLENRVVTEIDHFVTLHQKLDVEYISLRRRCERIETHVGLVH